MTDNREEHMLINQDALMWVLNVALTTFLLGAHRHRSIGVFDMESHANMHMQRTKPGLSLNGTPLIACRVCMVAYKRRSHEHDSHAPGQEAVPHLASPPTCQH